MTAAQVVIAIAEAGFRVDASSADAVLARRGSISLTAEAADGDDGRWTVKTRAGTASSMLSTACMPSLIASLTDQCQS